MHNDYTLAPESMEVTTDMTSDYSRNLKKQLDVPKYISTKTLVPNLFDKSYYVVHYRNLKFYLEQGMQLKAIHRVLAFQQSTWLKRYIDFNTENQKRLTIILRKIFIN